MPAARRVPMQPCLSTRRAVISGGVWNPYPRKRSQIERREEWSLVAFDEDPWPVQGTPCSSNVRVVCTTYIRSRGAQAIDETVLEEILPWGDRSGGARYDLRVTFPDYGRQYLYTLNFWLLKGRYLKYYFGDWDAFKQSGKQVDHGEVGRPDMLDYRQLRILPATGRLSNAAQGARLRWEYGSHGGLGKLVKPTLKKKPSARKVRATPICKKASCTKCLALEHVGIQTVRFTFPSVESLSV